MEYFTIKRSLFIVPTEQCYTEFEKIGKFMDLLEKSGVGKIVESVKFQNQECKERKGYKLYNLFAMIIYSFAKFNASLRDIEVKTVFDIRIIYII